MEKLHEILAKTPLLAGGKSPDNQKIQAAFQRGKDRALVLCLWIAEHPRPNPLEVEQVSIWERQYEAIDKKLRELQPVISTCQLCHDTGWMLSGDDKVPIPCRCSKFNPAENLRGYSGVPERRWRDTFETFNLKRAPAMAEALKAATEFASRASVPWLVLAGNIGCGKTHLCYAVANRMTADGVVVRFWNVAYLLDVIRSTYDQGKADSNPRESVEDMVYTPTVLILDDLGAEKGSDWVTEKLFEVIDRRYSEGKGLLITTNEDTSHLSPRLQSRFKDKEMCRVVICNSPDYRTKLMPSKVK